MSNQAATRGLLHSASRLHHSKRATGSWHQNKSGQKTLEASAGGGEGWGWGAGVGPAVAGGGGRAVREKCRASTCQGVGADVQAQGADHDVHTQVGLAAHHGSRHEAAGLRGSAQGWHIEARQATRRCSLQRSEAAGSTGSAPLMHVCPQLPRAVFGASCGWPHWRLPVQIWVWLNAQLLLLLHQPQQQVCRRRSGEPLAFSQGKVRRREACRDAGRRLAGQAGLLRSVAPHGGDTVRHPARWCQLASAV